MRTMAGIERLPSLESMGSISWAIVGVAFLFIASWGAGLLLRRWLKSACPTGLEYELAYSAAGLTIVAFSGVTIGATAGLPGAFSLLPLALFSLYGLASAVRSIHVGLLERAKKVRMQPIGTSGSRYYFPDLPRLRLLLVAPCVLLTLGPALNYPTGWDELVYHSVLPRLWMADGWPAFYGDLPYSGFPSLVEILCWMSAPIESLVTSRLLAWSIWIIGLYLLYTVARDVSDARAALILTLSLGASQTSLMISQNCYVEVFLLLFVAAMLVIMRSLARQWRAGGSSVSPLIILGIIAGGAAATKLTGGILVVIPLLWLVTELWNSNISPPEVPVITKTGSRRGKLATKQFVDTHEQRKLRGLSASTRSIPLISCRASMLVVTMVAIASPFFLRPWFLAGNPCYPFFAAWFTSNTAMLETSNYHHAIGGSVFGMRGVVALLFSPIYLAWDQALFDGRIGWQWLVLLGLTIRVGWLAAATHGRPSRRVGMPNRTSRPATGNRSAINVSYSQLAWPTHLLLTALILYLFWFLTAQQSRLAIPLFVVVVVLGAAAIKSLAGRTKMLVEWLLVVSTIVSLPWANAGYYFASWETNLGIWSRTDWVNDSLTEEYIELATKIDEATSPGSRILLLIENRSLYIPRCCIIGTPFFQAPGLTPPEHFGTAEALHSFLANRRISHLVIANKSLGPDRAEDWWNRLGPVYSAVQSCLNDGRLEDLWSSSTYSLLSVNTTQPL